jgi:hypothetical protein
MRPMTAIGSRLVAIALFTAGLAACDILTAGPYSAPVVAPAAAVLPASMRPDDPTLARIYFFRDYDTSGTMQWTSVALNGRKVGDIAQGEYFYRDVIPDTYTVVVRSQGIHSDQFATVAALRGSTTFIQVFSSDFYAAQPTTVPFSFSGPATFGDVVVPPGPALARIARLHPQS